MTVFKEERHQQGRVEEEYDAGRRNTNTVYDLYECKWYNETHFIVG